MLSLFAPKSEWHAPSPLYALLSSPVAFTATSIYYASLALQRLPSQPTHPITIVCISDTHTQIPDEVPDGDVLIHAGDMCNTGDVVELQTQIDWLRSLPHQHKIVIAGNHDAFLDPRSRQTLHVDQRHGKLDFGDLQYLQHGDVELVFPAQGGRRLRVYGAPQVPIDGPEHAFRYERGLDAWSETIPDDIDILITHTPPKYHRDLPAALGCEWLLKETWRVRPRLHVCGHIHAGSGVETVRWDDCQKVYERIRHRASRGWTGGVLNALNWLDLGLLYMMSLRNVIWSLVWGGETQGGLLVNAALTSQETGRLEQKPQVVTI